LENLIPILQTVGLVFGAYYLLFLVAVAIWTYRDIRARTQDLTAQVLAVALVIVLQIPGLVLYLLMRPKQTLAERYEHALEEEYLRRDIEEELVCPTCQRGAEQDFVLCPYCTTELRQRCRRCDRVIDLTWQVCPYCATPTGSTGETGALQMPQQMTPPRTRVYS
jgi:RNA polymerase subunit RPABC4/transcription elongation factor Spt4